MKFFVAILTVSFFISAYGTGCGKETGADINLINKVKAGDFNFEDDKMKDFFFCMFKKMGFINDDGKIFKDVILTTTTDENRHLVQKALDDCDGTTGPTLKDLSWNYAKCYSKGYPEDVFIQE